jgi:ABC-2 type transport system permease protein
MPAAAKAVMYALPLTHSSECLRAAALAQLFRWLSLVALLSFGVAFFIGSIIALKKSVCEPKFFLFLLLLKV